MDEKLTAFAAALRQQGRRVLGHIQVKGDAPGNCGCRHMHLLDLQTGTLCTISENRGPQARGCHLDRNALARIAQQTEHALASSTDLLIVNRFGRAEAEGHGMRRAICTAMEREVPVIVGVRLAYQEVWDSFHGGLAQPVSRHEM